MEHDIKHRMIRNLCLSIIDEQQNGDLTIHFLKGGLFMTIYNINFGIGWASSGVEYAQSYRAQMLRHLKEDAKFIF